MNFQGPYVDFTEKRVKTIIDYYGKDWFKNKKTLEVGCGYADLGNKFYELGADVTSCDAREEHLKIVNEKYPHIITVKCDLDNEWNFVDYFDLIIHTGTLYHLKNYEQNLKNCFNNCNHLFLETIVSDSDDENFVAFVNESNGIDQSFNGIGCRPSEKNIEKIITSFDFSFQRWFKEELNSMETAIFNWEIMNTNACCINNALQSFVWLRRAWFCENKNKK